MITVGGVLGAFSLLPAHFPDVGDGRWQRTDRSRRRYRGGMATMFWRSIDSPLGPLTLAGSTDELRYLEMEGQTHPAVDREHWVHDDRAFGDAVVQLGEYFAGDRTTFDLDVELSGTDFQREIWAALAAIPYGETRSYAELARAVGRPKAFRAAGTANGHNPVAIIVPCHRVIATGGGLGGYGGGLDRKAQLLDLERTVATGR